MLGGPLRAQLLSQHGPLDLLVEVAAQVPRHELEERQRVGRLPPAGLVAGLRQAQHGVLQAQLGGGAALEVGIDAGGVVGQRLPGGTVEQLQLRLGDVLPAQRAQEAIAGQGLVAEHLGRAAPRRVAPRVHLEEAVLGVDETQRAHQVPVAGAHDGGHPEVVAVDPDRPVEHLQRQRAADLGVGTPHAPGQRGGQYDGDGDQGHRGAEQPPSWPAARSPPRLARGWP